MKRIPIVPDLSEYPERFHELLSRHPVYDSSCSNAARVFFIDTDGGLYLKSARRGTLEAEAKMTRYFHGKGLTAQVLDHLSLERDWLLTARVPGEDCLDRRYLDAPERLCDTLATLLRRLHSMDAPDCPVCHPLSDGVAPVLIHGDFCLPNVMLDDWRFSGLIDLGDAGLGDRHVDLYWGMWSLQHNLGTGRFSTRFLDAYGREDVDHARLQAIAAEAWPQT